MKRTRLEGMTRCLLVCGLCGALSCSKYIRASVLLYLLACLYMEFYHPSEILFFSILNSYIFLLWYCRLEALMSRSSL